MNYNIKLKYNMQTQITESTDNENYIKLLQDIKDLNEINNNLYNLLHKQDIQIENILENNNKSIDSLETSNKNIIEASKLKLKTKASLIGGVFGSVIIGPTGILIGTKCVIYMTVFGGIMGSILGNKLG